jgi:hypothetical protein
MSTVTKTLPIHLGLSGHARAWLELASNEVAWNEVLTAILVLEGGQVAHRITRDVEARLHDFSPPDDSGSSGASSQCTRGAPHGPFVVQPGKTVRFPVQVKVPWGTPCQNDIHLVVSIRSGVWNQSVSAKVHVLPPQACRLAAAGLAEAGEMDIHRWEWTRLERLEATFVPRSCPHPFSQATLALEYTSGDWWGRLTVYLEGQGLARLFPKKHVIPVPFLKRGHDRVRTEFEQFYRDASLRPGGGSNLPLPADPPGPSIMDLPLPAGRTQPDVTDLPSPASRDGVGDEPDRE